MSDARAIDLPGLDATARAAAREAEARREPPAIGEAALVAAAQRGDKRAFAELIDRHQRTVFGYLRARLLEPSDAEDLCQEVFLRCYLGREKLARAAAVGPWLIGIARNLLREHTKKSHRRREVAWTELCLQLDSLSAAGPETDDALTHLPACLETLGPSAREALQLRYQQELRLAEIGGLLKRSEGAVKLLMHRARQALKHCLDGKLRASRHD